MSTTLQALFPGWSRRQYHPLSLAHIILLEHQFFQLLLRLAVLEYHVFSFLVMTLKLFGRVLTPRTEIDSKSAKKMALVFLCYLVISFPHHTISVLKVFCSSCGLKKHSLSLELRCLLYSSSAVIPLVLISSLPELRARAQWCCFRFRSINEESRNDLYAMEIPGVQSRNGSN